MTQEQIAVEMAIIGFQRKMLNVARIIHTVMRDPQLSALSYDMLNDAFVMLIKDKPNA